MSEGRPPVFIHGLGQISAQMYDQLRRRRCEDRAADNYAFFGERHNRCVCGFHEGDVPLPPLFRLDQADEA